MSYYDDQREKSRKSVNLYSGRITPEAQEESEAWEFSKSQHEMVVKINDEMESDDVKHKLD